MRRQSVSPSRSGPRPYVAQARGGALAWLNTASHSPACPGPSPPPPSPSSASCPAAGRSRRCRPRRRRWRRPPRPASPPRGCCRCWRSPVAGRPAGPRCRRSTTGSPSPTAGPSPHGLPASPGVVRSPHLTSLEGLTAPHRTTRMEDPCSCCLWRLLPDLQGRRSAGTPQVLPGGPAATRTQPGHLPHRTAHGPPPPGPGPW